MYKRLIADRRVVIVVGLLLIAASTAFVLVRDPFGWFPPSEEALRLQERMEYRREIADLTYTPLEASTMPEFAAAMERERQDPRNLVSSAQFEMLKETLSRQLLARASPDPADYVALAQEEGTRWIEADNPDDERQWSLIDGRHTALFGRPAPRDDLPGALRRFLQYSYEKDHSRLTGVNVTDRPPFVYIYRIRTWIDVVRLAHKPMTDEQLDDWFNAPAHSGFRFRKPKRSLDEVLREERSATCAAVFTMVETEAGNQYNWETYWYWEPANQRWENYKVVRRGWYGHVMHF